jgi:hypothetical protein
MFNLLLRLFVSRFYAVNAGFFLFWFLLFFGVVSGSSLISYHLGLIQAIIDHIVMLLIVMAGWSLYALKCLRYMEDTQRAHHASFLHILGGVEKPRLRWLLGGCFTLMFTPVSIYMIVVMLIGWQQGRWIPAISIPLLLVVLTLLATRRMLRLVTAGAHLPKILFFERWLRRKRPLRYHWWLVAYAVAERKMSLLLLKAFSFLMLFLAIIWLKDDFVKPAFMVLLVLIAVAHAAFMSRLQQFMEERMAFLRNLPVPLAGILSMFLLPAILVFLPDLLFLVANARGLLSLADIGMVYAVLVSQLVLYTAVLYLTAMPAKTYMRILFLVSFAQVFGYMALDNRLLALGQVLVGCVLLALRYRRYEHVMYKD